MKKSIILFGALFLCLLTLQATENNNELNNYEIRTKGRIISFVEIETNKVTKTINKVDNNPFMQKIGQKRDAKIGVLDFKLTDINSIDIKQERKDLLKYINENMLWVKTVPQIFFTENKKYLVISYNLSFGEINSEGSIFSIAHIFVYNSKGEQIGEAYFNDRVCGFPVLSERAEHLGFKFELPYGQVGRIKTGFAIYDFKQKKIVVEDFVPKGFDGTYTVISDNQMMYSIKNSQVYIYVLQDLDLKRTYRKTFKKEKYFKLMKKNKEGLYFKTDDKEEFELISFEKDFDIIEW